MNILHVTDHSNLLTHACVSVVVSDFLCRFKLALGLLCYHYYYI